MASEGATKIKPFANPALRRAGLGHLAVGDSPRSPPRNGCRSADSPDGGGRRGFALFCLATAGLILLPMAGPYAVDNGLLPYIAPTTDWIRLPRRFPVTVDLVNPPPGLTLYMGADARCIVFP